MSSKKIKRVGLTLILLSSFLGFRAFSMSEFCVEDPNEKVTLYNVYSTMRRIINTNEVFNALKAVKISIVTIENDRETFFRTMFELNPISKSSRFYTSEKAQYFIYVNEDVNDCTPPEIAVEGILVHELFHILDYVKKNFFSMVGLGLSYGPEYERYTDLRAAELGYTEGLISYREWIYSILPDEEALAKKKKFYLTPEELEEL